MAQSPSCFSLTQEYVVLGAGPQQQLPRSADLPVNVQFSLLGPVRAWRGPAELDLGMELNGRQDSQEAGLPASGAG